MKPETEAPPPVLAPPRHPIERVDVRRDVISATRDMLARTGGSGQVCVEVDYKDYKVARIYIATRARMPQGST